MKHASKTLLFFWSFLLLAVLFLPFSSAFAQDEKCGYCPPSWCTLENSEAQRLKEKKKDWLRSRGLPERYVALYDGLDNCRKCIEFSSDWPSIILVPSAEGWKEAGGEAPYTRRTTQWSRQLEQTARKHMREGLLESFHVTIEKTCRCCKPEHGTSLEALARWQDDGHSLTPKGDTSGWDADNEFTDDTTISFDDKNELGKDPEDLTNLPEALKSGEARIRPRDEFRSSEPPIRVVQAFCTACKPLAAEYNEIGKDIMEQRHYITRRLTEVDFLRQLIDNLYNDIETMSSTLANSPETREELNRMRERASSLQDSIKHTERQIAEARQRIITLEGRLDAKMVELKACEDRCQKETGSQISSAGDQAAETVVEAETKEPKYKITEPEYKFTSPTIEFDNPADALDFKGWRQKDDRRETVFPKKLKTDCKPCVLLVEEFNETINSLLFTRFLIVDAEERLASLDEHYKWEINELKKKGGTSTSDAAKLLGRWAVAEEAMEQLLATLRSEEAMLFSHASKLISEIETCEKQCTSGTKTGLSLGDREIPESEALELPFPWDGPYSTACWRCEKLAAELNTLPPIARELLVEIKRSEAAIERIKNDARFFNNILYPYGTSTPESDGQERIRSLEFYIGNMKDKLERVKRHFHTVKRMLDDCEKTCSPVAGTAIIELEEAITVSGANPFRADEIEELIEGEGDDSTPPPSPPTPATPTPSIPGIPTDPEPSEPEEPSAPALTVNTVGSISFAHTVGGSSCPQSAGVVTLSSNNGNPLSVSNVSDSGTIASRLDQNVNGNNTTSPQIAASFNCSSAQNGTFTGNITLTVTDTVTGETQTVTIPATGTVSG